ncbi:MAG: metal ABC transporter solute-binding protein, Zn/Mn family [Opitutales bacterium]
MKVNYNSVRRRLLALGWFCGLLLLAAPARAADLQVWVTLEPQAYVVERIGGEAVGVQTLVPSGRSPATYAPTPLQLEALSGADLLFGMGMPMEKRLMERMGGVVRKVQVVGVETWRLENEALADGSEGHGHGHQHDACAGGLCATGPMDPHLWMDLLQMQAFAEKVAATLSALRPDAAADFARRAAELNEDLRVLDADIARQLAPYRGRAFFINHASLGHFAARYGLEQRSIEIVGGAPSSRRVQAMLREARAANATAILAQVQFSRTTADVLARALDLPILPVDPLRRDYLQNLTAVSEALLQAFGPQEPGD